MPNRPNYGGSERILRLRKAEAQAPFINDNTSGASVYARENPAMRCPFCQNEDTQVKDSRPTDDNSAIRRRRLCNACGARFTTFERVQLRDLNVLKRNNRREAFDRDKLMRSIQHAIRKRPVEPERLERMVNGIVRRLESSGETDIPSTMIGELVMQGLANIDAVAYVRFASVYKNFREAKDFESILEELGHTEIRPVTPRIDKRSADD